MSQKFTQKELVGLFKALGKTKAKEWPKKLLQGRFGTITQLAQDNPELVNALDDTQNALLNRVNAAIADKEEVEIEFSEPVQAEKSAEQPKKKKKKKVQEEDKSTNKSSKKDAKVSKNGEAKKSAKKPVGGVAGTKPGIIDTMLEVLRSGSKDSPVTREQVHKALKKKFPKRDADGMWTTVVSQLPTRLLKRGENIKQSAEGYWISSGKKKVV